MHALSYYCRVRFSLHAVAFQSPSVISPGRLVRAGRFVPVRAWLDDWTFAMFVPVLSDHVVLCLSLTLQNIRECFNDDACIGSAVSQRISSPNDYCDTGYMGPCESSSSSLPLLLSSSMLLLLLFLLLLLLIRRTGQCWPFHTHQHGRFVFLLFL